MENVYNDKKSFILRAYFKTKSYDLKEQKLAYQDLIKLTNELNWKV